ncbi:MAG: nuclear transport factor 2 family protein [Proteobacteria bacterium]|nr:nuclear transport factor 2 family protein [Pseudomonadota bacterium]HQR03801.1 nuclear transport factor 2 family protein [Rhodocyclaceae bacterium]
MPKTFFATPQDVEAAFYEALEKADLEAMMTVWCEDEEVACIYPGGPRMTGYAAVREIWRRGFENRPRFHIRTTLLSTVENPFTTVHTVVEYFSIESEPRQAALIAATNIYIRGAQGWRLAVRHASPVPPEALDEGPKILH